MILRINPVVIHTFARIEAARAFVEMVNEGIPAVAAKENEYLEKFASEGE